MPTEVKICGLSGEEGVDAALEAGADFVGFMLFPPSPRNVSLERAAALAARARGKAQIVAMTVDGDDALLGAIAETLQPDFLQLHGKETPERVSAIRAMTGVPVMKAVGVAGEGRSRRHRELSRRTASSSTRSRRATPPGPAATASPSTGRSCRISQWPGPWFLSGGLKTKNVSVALQATRAPGVDVSSGVESAPGRKDPARIHAFVKAVRAFDRQAGEPASGTDKERAA